MLSLRFFLQQAKIKPCCSSMVYFGKFGVCCDLINQKSFSSRSLFTKVLKHSEKREVLVPQDVMFDVVLDVNRYKDFVPWCLKSDVISKSKNTAKAKLAIGFGPIQEHYNSTIIFNKPKYIKAVCVDGLLFHMLECTWKFSEGTASSTTIIDFDVSFEFRSIVYSNLAQTFFNEVVKKMVTAFEKQAKIKSQAQD